MYPVTIMSYPVTLTIHNIQGAVDEAARIY